MIRLKVRVIKSEERHWANVDDEIDVIDHGEDTTMYTLDSDEQKNPFVIQKTWCENVGFSERKSFQEKCTQVYTK